VWSFALAPNGLIRCEPLVTLFKFEKVQKDTGLTMKPDSLEGEKFSTYEFTLCLVAGLTLSEALLGWYLVSQDYGRVSYIRILLTTAVLIGLWLQSHAARYFGAIWLLVSVGVLIWMLFAAHKVAFNFAAVLVFLSGALSLIASYILLFSRKFRSEFERLEKMQPDYKRVLRRALIALVISVFVITILNDIQHLFFG
jgi:hypothetical protein